MRMEAQCPRAANLISSFRVVGSDDETHDAGRSQSAARTSRRIRLETADFGLGLGPAQIGEHGLQLFARTKHGPDLTPRLI